jgi:hypothetical protein
LPTGDKKLVLGHRVTLLAEAAERHGLEYYRDSNGVREGSQLDSSSHGLALCINSLPRLTLKHWKDINVLVIDEATQFVEHLFSGICRGMRKELFDKLGFLLDHSSHIILADADLNEDTVSFFTDLMKRGAEVSVTVNEFKPIGAPYFELGSRTELIGLASALVLKGEKVMFHCSSKTMSDLVFRTLGVVTDKKGFLLNSDNSTNEAEVEFVRHINREVLQYDYVVTSPSLGTGVSIDIEHFNFVFLLASINCQLDSTQLHQLFHRVRNPKARFFCIEGQRVSGFELELEYQRQQSEKLSRRDLTMVLDDEGNYIPSPHDKTNELCLRWEPRLAVKKAQSIANLRTDFIEYIQNENPAHELHLKTPIDFGERFKSLLRGTRFLVDMDSQRAIVHAPDLTEEQAYALFKKGRLGAEEQAAIIKWKMQRYYKTLDLTPEMLKGWLKGKVEERYQHFLDVFWQSPKTLEQLDLEQTYDPALFPKDRENYGRKRELVIGTIQRAFGSTGRALNGRVFTTEQLLTENGFNEWFETNKGEFRFLFDLRAKEPLGGLKAVLEWAGLGLECHRNKRRAPIEVPVISASKNVLSLTPQTKLDAKSIEYQERYYSISGFNEQVQRANRLEPKHRTIKTRTTLLYFTWP